MPSKRRPDGSKPAAASGMLEQKQRLDSDERPSDLSSNVPCAIDNEYKCPAPLGSNMDEHIAPEARLCDMSQPMATNVACNALTPVVAKAVASGSRPDVEVPPRRQPSVPVLALPRLPLLLSKLPAGRPFEPRELSSNPLCVGVAPGSMSRPAMATGGLVASLRLVMTPWKSERQPSDDFAPPVCPSPAGDCSRTCPTRHRVYNLTPLN